MAKKEANNLLSVDFILKKKRQVVPFSPSIDCICGGISEGTVNIISGPCKAGKTTGLMHHSCKAQTMGKDIYYFNIENRLKARDIESIKDLKHDKFFIISSTPEEKNEKGEVIKEAKIWSAEDYLTELEKLLKDKPNSIFILDSESMLATSNELTSELGDQQRAEAAKLLAKFMRRNMPTISLNNQIVWVVRHTMANPSGMGAGSAEKGSGAGSYACDLRLIITYTERWLIKDQQIGQKVHFKLGTGYLDGAMSGATAIGHFKFGEGIDEESEICELAVNLGIIKQAGAWYQLQDERKFQGQEKLAQALKDDKTLKDNIFKEIKEMLGWKY